MTKTPASPGPVGGARLAALFDAASTHLRTLAEAINAINVYPVPDGDTGSNMAASLEAATAQVAGLEASPSVSAVLAAIARGALYGGRGNSGVILSQALRGLAAGAGDVALLDAAALARGLVEGARSAYAAVAAPSEGTMLTVLRAAGEAAQSAAASLPDGGRGAPCLDVLRAALTAAESAEAATPEQLPALAEAGVTDAGGEGICVILRGLVAALSGEAVALASRASARTQILPGSIHDGFGHCTEFVLEPAASPVNRETILSLLRAYGATSVVIGGDEDAFRVHAHLEAPSTALDAVARLGKVSQLKSDDMDRQHARFAAQGSAATARLALLALSPAAGFDRVFAGLGAATAPLSLFEKPSAGEIADAAEKLGTREVIVLPNHKNVVLAADQAKGLARCTLHIVATTSLAQGVAAAMAFDVERTAPENVFAMQAALAGVRTVEVTFAATDSRADGLAVKQGDAIAMLDGHLVATAESAADAASQAVARVEPAEASLITLYVGAEVENDGADRLREAIAALFPGADIEVVEGGQELYPYIIAVEA